MGLTGHIRTDELVLLDRKHHIPHFYQVGERRPHLVEFQPLSIFVQLRRRVILSKLVIGEETVSESDRQIA